MKNIIPLVILSLLVLVTVEAQASMINFLTFTGEGADISVDAVGVEENTNGTVSAEIAANATIQAAYLYSAARNVNVGFPAEVIFNGTTLVSDANNRLDVGVKDGNSVANEHRWDVTSIVQSEYNNTGGIFNFTVNENHNWIEGEILAVVYGVTGEAVQTAMIFDGEISNSQNYPGGSIDIDLVGGYDGTSDAILSLGISTSYQSNIRVNQDTQVDINGNRLTSSAGGQDDGFSLNGGLITAGGIGDSILNPANPFAQTNGDPRQDDELYNLASLLNAGDTRITIDMLNPDRGIACFLRRSPWQVWQV